ncbi:MAG: hypothetical protein K8R69_11700 [Deltaproteobacteria bacterium]|nr:hypothetical protein [Deltaproteobacteria bacterium]
MRPPFNHRRRTFILFGVITLIGTFAILSGCDCRRKAQKSDTPAPLSSKPARPLEERKSALEDEIRDRLQEIDRAAQRMQGKADAIDASLRPKWKAAMDQMQEGETTAAKRVDSLKGIEEGNWEEFQRDTHRALDELDLLREDAEAYFKEKS